MSARSSQARPRRRLALATALALVAPLLVLTVATAPAEAARLNLHRGSHGAKVKVFETRLSRAGYLLASAVDRRYRAATVKAVKRFQRAHGLRVNGKTNRRVWNLVTREAAQHTLPPAPTVIGHRGAVRTWMPENTLQALRFAHGYADVLEFDLRVTADDQVVLMHDARLDRTTNCTGLVSAWTLADLRAQCAVASKPVPTLEEAAAYAASVTESVAPEIKDDDISDENLAQVLSVLQSYGLAGRTYLQSFSASVLARVHAVSPSLKKVLVSNTAPAITTAEQVGATRVAVRMGNLSTGQVDAYQNHGLKVWTFTASDRAGLAEARAKGVNAVVTDIPRTAANVYR